MRTPELFAIACAALIASAAALGQPRGSGAGAGPPIAPVGTPAPTESPRGIGAERSSSALDLAVQQRNTSPRDGDA